MPPSTELRAVLNSLQAELADLAYTLDRAGRRDAADVVMMISVRMAELGGASRPVPDGPDVRHAGTRS